MTEASAPNRLASAHDLAAAPAAGRGSKRSLQLASDVLLADRPPGLLRRPRRVRDQLATGRRRTAAAAEIVYARVNTEVADHGIGHARDALDVLGRHGKPGSDGVGHGRPRNLAASTAAVAVSGSAAGGLLQEVWWPERELGRRIDAAIEVRQCQDPAVALQVRLWDCRMGAGPGPSADEGRMRARPDRRSGAPRTSPAASGRRSTRPANAVGLDANATWRMRLVDGRDLIARRFAAGDRDGRPTRSANMTVVAERESRCRIRGSSRSRDAVADHQPCRWGRRAAWLDTGARARTVARAMAGVRRQLLEESTQPQLLGRE